MSKRVEEIRERLKGCVVVVDRGAVGPLVPGEIVYYEGKCPQVSVLDALALLAELDRAEKVIHTLFKYTGEYGREEDATKLMREYDPSREWKLWEM